MHTATYRYLVLTGCLLSAALARGVQPPITQQQLPLPGLLVQQAVPEGLQRWQVESIWPRGTVNAIVLSPDFTMVAIGGDDTQVRIFDTKTWELRFLFTGHDAAITGLGWSKDSKGLAAGDASGTIHRWDVFGKKVAASHIAKGNPVSTLLRFPHGRVVSAHQDGTLRSWEASRADLDWQTKADRRRVHAVSSDYERKSVAAAGEDGKVRNWSYDGIPEHVIAAHAKQARALDWSP